MPYTPIIIAKTRGKLREGLVSLLENQPSIKIIGAVQDESSLLGLLGQLPTDCIILLDIDLFGQNTFDMLKRIHIEYPHACEILLVNTFNQQRNALSAGLTNLLVKGFTANDLLMMIQQVKTDRRGKKNFTGISQEIEI